MLRSLFLSRLLEGRVDRTEELAARYDVDLSGPSLAAALVHIHAPRSGGSCSPSPCSSSLRKTSPCRGMRLPSFCTRRRWRCWPRCTARSPSTISLPPSAGSAPFPERYLGVKLTVGVGTPAPRRRSCPSPQPAPAAPWITGVWWARAAPSTSGTWSRTPASARLRRNDERAVTAAVKLGSAQEVRTWPGS